MATTDVSTAGAISRTLTIQPSYVIAWQRKVQVVVDFSDDRTRFGRQKGSAYSEYDLIFRNRTLSEYQDFVTFWNQHYPAWPFSWTDDFQSASYTCYFISDISAEVQSDCSIDFRVRIQTTA